MNLETFIAICEVMEDEFAKSMRKQGMYITPKKKKKSKKKRKGFRFELNRDPNLI
jgi:hypothetical protein